MQNYKSMEELYAESVNDDWHIKNFDEADWAIQQIAQARNKTQYWEDVLQAEMDKIKAKNQSTEDFFTGHLARYFDTLPLSETKTQFSFNLLPGAKLVRKKESQKFTQEKEELLKYFKENHMEEFIKVEESPKWGDFKKQIEVNGSQVIDKETGEVVKGITVEIVPSQFTVQLKGDMNE